MCIELYFVNGHVGMQRMNNEEQDSHHIVPKPCSWIEAVGVVVSAHVSRARLTCFQRQLLYTLASPELQSGTCASARIHTRHCWQIAGLLA